MSSDGPGWLEASFPPKVGFDFGHYNCPTSLEVSPRLRDGERREAIASALPINHPLARDGGPFREGLLSNCDQLSAIHWVSLVPVV